MEDFGGIGVIYFTDDSSNESQTGIDNAIHQGETTTIAPSGDSFLNIEKIQEEVVASHGCAAMDRADPNAFLLPNTIDQEDAMANQQYFEEFTKEKESTEAENNLFYYQDDGNDAWEEGQGDGIFEDLPYE